MENNEFLKLIDSPLLKTDNVNRYSGIYQASPELLSVHIVDVQFLALMIARNFLMNSEPVNIGILLEKCLIHDIDETLTGDFTRLVKYSSKTCHDALEAVAESVVSEISKDIDKTNYILNIWKSSKDDTTEGYILKLCDMLSVIKKISKEVDFLGNNNFLKVAIEVRSYIDDLNKTIPTYLFRSNYTKSYIELLLKGVMDYLDDLIESHKDIIDKLSIDNSTVRYIVNNRFNKPNL